MFCATWPKRNGVGSHVEPETPGVVDQNMLFAIATLRPSDAWTTDLSLIWDHVGCFRT